MRLEWRPVAIGDGPEISTSLTAAESKELQRLAKDVPRALEIGSAFGYSAVLTALVAKRVVAVDPHIALNSLNTLTHNLQHYNVEGKVDVKPNYSQFVLPFLQPKSFDLVFVDGDHHESSVTHDITWAIRLVRRGGFVAVHDYGEATCPDVRGVCDDLLPGGKLTDTLWVWQKPTPDTAEK